MSAIVRIAAVTVDAEPFTLRIRWRTGDESRVDVSGLVNRFRAYAPLEADIKTGLADVAAGRIKKFDRDKIIARGKKLLATRNRQFD